MPRGTSVEPQKPTVDYNAMEVFLSQFEALAKAVLGARDVLNAARSSENDVQYFTARVAQLSEEVASLTSLKDSQQRELQHQKDVGELQRQEISRAHQQAREQEAEKLASDLLKLRSEADEERSRILENLGVLAKRQEIAEAATKAAEERLDTVRAELRKFQDAARTVLASPA